MGNTEERGRNETNNAPKNLDKQPQERRIDEELEQTFPASDPPSFNQPGHGENATSNRRSHQDELKKDRDKSQASDSDLGDYSKKATGFLEVKPHDLDAFKK